MLEVLDSKSVEHQIEWIRNMHVHYNEISGRIQSFIAKERDLENAQKQNPLRLEKVKVPLFTEEKRDYPWFKTDFEKQVMPTINEENAPYILRSCLSKEPADVVKRVDDDLDTMWKRLDEKCRDPAKVVDVIMNAIQDTRNLKDGENKKIRRIYQHCRRRLQRLKEIRIRKGNNHD